MSEIILEIKNISKSYGVVKALNNITVSIKRGEIHALCGENGAGKSTLMKVLDGYIPFGEYEGEFYLDGKPCQFKTPHDSIENGIAMIYQEINIMSFLTIAENIFVGELPLKMGFVNKRLIFEKAEKLLEMVGLKKSPKEIAGNLNASQQQLLMIARAFVKKTKILILDEPTSALTSTETKQLMIMLKNLKEQGVTCIYISHKLDEIAKIADRLTVLRDGEVVTSFNKDEFDINLIIHAMVGRDLKTLHPKRNFKVGEEVLRVQNLSVPNKKIKGRYFVKNINFFLRKGEILGIAGLVGSGRSELVNSIIGYLKKETGNITVYGKKVNIKSPSDAINNHMFLLTEERKATGLFLERPIKENITAASLSKINKGPFINKQNEDKQSKEQFDKLGIKAPSINTLVSELSGGNQQKVVLGKALMTSPKILFLDEPTRGIDIGAKSEIYNIMNNLVEKGYSIVMISSELPELLNMCDRFIVLSNGVLTGEFSREEANEKIIMKAATKTTN